MKCRACGGSGSLFTPCFGEGFSPAQLESKHQIFLALIEAITEQDFPNHANLRIVLEVGCEPCGGSGMAFHLTKVKMKRIVHTFTEPQVARGCGEILELEEVSA
jgi:hypothetical protein